jgi:hypothetical protein
MAGAIDITLDDLCGVFDPATVRAVFCDDGTGRPGRRLDTAISAGRRMGDAILMTGWGADAIESLVAEDEGIRTLMCRLIVACGMIGKAEWSGAGAPYENLEKQTLDRLKMIALGQARSSGESVAGANPNIAGVTIPAEPNFLFAPSASRPRRGGY